MRLDITQQVTPTYRLAIDAQELLALLASMTLIILRMYSAVPPSIFSIQSYAYQKGYETSLK